MDIVCETVVVLPQASVPVKVLIINPAIPSENTSPLNPIISSSNVMTTSFVVPSIGIQKSTATAIPPVAAGSQASVHSIVISGGATKVGLISFTIVMICVSWIVLPHASVTINVRSMVTSPGQDPLIIVSSEVKLAGNRHGPV